MTNEGAPPSATGQPSASVGDTPDEGRRYWKAAIAHLAPEKREAAWEFYLDRLESSPAADTLGGVMLLLEAHLAFFDDLPARLVSAVQHMEAAVGSAGSIATSPGAPSAPPRVKAVGTDGNNPTSSKRKLPLWAAVVLSAALGAAVAGAGAFSYLRFRDKLAAQWPSRPQDVLLSHAHAISVDPWYDAVTHRQRGCVVSFDRADRTEHTAGGGAKVYVLSPVEEIRHDLESLRQLAPSHPSKVP